MYLVQGNPYSFLRIYPRDLAQTLSLHYKIVNKKIIDQKHLYFHINTEETLATGAAISKKLYG